MNYKILNILFLFFLIFTFSDNCVAQIRSHSEEGSSHKKLAVGISFSPDYTYYRQRQSPGMSYGVSEFEVPRLGFTTGLNARYKLNDQFSVTTGLQVSDRGYQLEFSSDDMRVIDGNVEDDPAIPDNIVSKYHFYYLRVPVSFNYYVYLGRFNLFISTGLSTDFFINARHRATYTFRDRVEDDKYEVPGDFNRINFTGLAGFGVETPLSDKLTFCLEPVFRYSFTPLADASEKDHLYSFGANISLLYEL